MWLKKNVDLEHEEGEEMSTAALSVPLNGSIW